MWEVNTIKRIVTGNHMHRNNAQKKAARRIQEETGAPYPQALRFAAYESTKILLGHDDTGRPVQLTVGQGKHAAPILVLGGPSSGKSLLMLGIAASLAAAGWRNVVDVRWRELPHLKDISIRHLDTHRAAAYLDAMIADRESIARSGTALTGPQGWKVAEPVMLLVDDEGWGVRLIEERVDQFGHLGIHAILVSKAHDASGKNIPKRLRDMATTTLQMSQDRDQYRGVLNERHGSGRRPYIARTWEETIGIPASLNWAQP